MHCWNNTLYASFLMTVPKLIRACDTDHCVHILIISTINMTSCNQMM